MKTIFAVMRTTYDPCECGARGTRHVEFVVEDKNKADTFVEEKKKERVDGSCWMPDYEVEEVEVR